jgi:hypothetical protein
MLKRAALTVLLILGLMMNALGQTRQTKAAPEAVGAKALAFFEQANGQSLDQYLKSIRPQQIPPDLKAYVMAQLPREAEVKPSASGRAKLAALEPVLNYHERGAAYEIKIGRIGKAYVGLYACAALLISEEALDLLTAEELQAVVAHEIGHDYFWHEYQLADRARQDGLVQELELRCDGVAIITMSQLGLDPARLMSAVTKLTKFNLRIGDHSRAYAYPSLDERLAFNRATTELVKARAAASNRFPNFSELFRPREGQSGQLQVMLRSELNR